MMRRRRYLKRMSMLRNNQPRTEMESICHLSLLTCSLVLSFLVLEYRGILFERQDFP